MNGDADFWWASGVFFWQVLRIPEVTLLVLCMRCGILSVINQTTRKHSRSMHITHLSTVSHCIPCDMYRQGGDYPLRGLINPTLTPVDRCDWKYYLSATSLAGSNKEAYIFQVINQPPWLRLTDTIWCHIFLQNRTVADVHRRILEVHRRIFVPLSA